MSAEAEVLWAALDASGVAALRLDDRGRVTGRTGAAVALTGSEVLRDLELAATAPGPWPPPAGALLELPGAVGVDLVARPLGADAGVVLLERPAGRVEVEERAMLALGTFAFLALALLIALDGADDAHAEGDIDAALARAACAVTGASGATVFAEHADGGLVVTHAAGWNATGARVLPGAHSGANLVHATGVPVFAADAQRDPRLSGANLRQSGAASVAIWPVQIDGRTAGAVLCWWAEPVAELSQRTERLLGAVADAAAVAIERRSLVGRLELVDRLDPLTGLGNSRAFEAELARRMEPPSERPVVVALLDLDRFAAYNHAHGHAAGDDLLRACASAWSDALGREGIIARRGTEQFAVLLDGHEGEQAFAVVEGLRAATPHGATCSAGVARWDTQEHAEGLLARAGYALHRAKATGRDTTCVAPFATGRAPLASVEPLRAVDAAAADVPAAELRRALAEGRFSLDYQPVFGALDGRLAGLEALVRLRGRHGEVIPPGRFIGAAEASGLIVSLGAWVIERSCAQVAAWRTQGLDVPPVAINLSPRQLDGPDPAEVIASALRRHGMAPSDFCVEVTESALVSGTDALVDVLRHLQGTGVITALDDFGAGHSSFSRLATLPFDLLKIDRALVADVGVDARATALLEGLVHLTRSIGLGTVVEGIETAEQHDASRSAGASLLQGFRLARPEPADVVARRLRPLGPSVARALSA